MPSPLVKSIVRDGQGIVWAATDDGLVRFDGREFRLFRNELPGLYAKSVLCLPRGEMLLTMDMGISRFSEISGEPRFETVGRGGLHPSDSLMWFPKMLFSDEQGRVWLSDNSRVYRYTEKGFKSFDLGSDVATNNFNRSFSFAGDGLGNFFAFAEPGYVFRYNSANDKLVRIMLPLQFSGVNAVFNISPGLILVATRGGLYEMKTSSASPVITVARVSDKDVSFLARNSKGKLFAGTWSEGLFVLSADAGGAFVFDPVVQYTEKVVNHLFIDNEDNIWVSSDIGILLLQETLFGSPFSDLTTSYIQCISMGISGDVFFTDGRKVFRAAPDSPGQARLLFETQSTVLQIIPVSNGFWLSDADGRIWLSDAAGRKIRDFNFSDRGNAVFKLLLDKKGNIWACQDINKEIIRISAGYAVSFYGVSKGLLSRSISLGMSATGKIYCGGMTDSAYLFEYNERTDRFVNLSRHLDFERNIDLNINDIACSPDGSLWLASSFGLISYRNGHFTRADLGGLTENSVKAVAVDSAGYVWLANNKGLYRYRDGDLMLFDERNGLPSKNVAYRGLLVDGSNRMWAGTLAGVAVSGKLGIPRHTLMPAVRSFLVNNLQRPFNPAIPGVFTNKSFISLQVASPEYPARHLIYERWIAGIDSAWIPVANDGIVLIGGLNPGKYTLRIRSRQSGNFVYSEPLVWKFQVYRIWYERWWVLALLLLSMALVFRLAMLWYFRKLKSDNEKLEMLITQRTKEIVLHRDHIEQQNQRIVRKNEALSVKNQELELAKNLAEEASKAKSQFLSVMSHEIRTPMNAVIGITHLLMRDNPRPEQLEDLKILKFSAENLLGLINDILDLNKIEAGKMVIESIDFNLKSLVEGVRSSMLHKTAEKGIFFNFSYDESLPLFFLSDPLRISQILNNLLSNAIKFTDSGGIAIDITSNGKTGSLVDVEFTVRDSGIGIPADMQQRIFSEFTQASSETSRKYGGTGLGLTITVKLLEMLESTIQLRSETDKGSTFSFRLKMQEGEVIRNTTNVDTAGNDLQRFSGQRILLVEDNKINELIVRKFMEDWNLKVDSATNGLIAIEKLNQQNYHLILMDLQMPEMDGYMTASIIRARSHEPFISIPIIALSASLKSEVQERIVLAGMNDFVSKPFNPDELYSKLRQYIS